VEVEVERVIQLHNCLEDLVVLVVEEEELPATLRATVERLIQTLETLEVQQVVVVEVVVLELPVVMLQPHQPQEELAYRI
jgi:hypothetical protein|tara:strand:+ start:189 stop:428 length:240 start_codon:yes stop_codon:yes gene_type:complete